MIQENKGKPLITVVGAASKQGRSVVHALLDASGGKAFPNADLFVSAAEYDFWTDGAYAAAAPAAMKPFFEMARTSAPWEPVL